MARTNLGQRPKDRRRKQCTRRPEIPDADHDHLSQLLLLLWDRPKLVLLVLQQLAPRSFGAVKKLLLVSLAIFWHTFHTFDEETSKASRSRWT